MADDPSQMFDWVEDRRTFLALLASLSTGCLPGSPTPVGPADGLDAGRGEDAGQMAAGDTGGDGGPPVDTNDDGGPADAAEDGQPQDEAQGCPLTASDVEGPYYTAGAPNRDDLIDPMMPGTPMRLSGRVLGAHCGPLAQAVVDVWQADDAGEYDNVGFTLRGKVFAADDGRYTIRTIIPGYYAPRPRHLHVKVSAAGHRLLTTQLYFNDDPENDTADTNRQYLNLSLIADERDDARAEFDFVLDPEPG